MPDKRILTITSIVFVNILGAGVILPVLPLYAEGTFGATVFQATLLATAFFGAQAIGAPILGRLSDRIGRRPVLIGSQIGTVLSFVLFYFAGELGEGIDGLGLPIMITGGLVMLYVARILDGITGGNITTAQAYIADVTTPDERAQNLGLIQAAFGVGFIFGPAFGGILGGLGPRVPFLGGAAITLVTLLMTIFLLEESLTEEKRESKANPDLPQVPVSVLLRNRPFALLLAVTFMGTLAFSAIPATFTLYADAVLFSSVVDDNIVIRNVGFMLTFMGVMSALTQVVALPRMVRRMGERMLVIVGLVVFAVGMIVTGFAKTTILVTLLLAPFAFGRGLAEPGLQALMSRFGSDRVQGQLLGLSQSARSMALILGPVWGGLVFEAIMPQAVWWIGGAFGLISVGLAWWFRQMPVEQKTVLKKVKQPAP